MSGAAAAPRVVGLVSELGTRALIVACEDGRLYRLERDGLGQSEWVELPPVPGTEAFRLESWARRAAEEWLKKQETSP